MWIKFVSEHWHRFTPSLKRRYLPGMVRNLPTAVAEKALKAGVAVRMKKPSKTAKPEEDNGEAARRG